MLLLTAQFIDAKAMFIYSMKKTFQNQEIVTILAFDIKGVFNRVTKDWLIKQLWE